MSSIKFDILVDEFPEESAAVGRLLELVRDGQTRPGRREFRPNRLYELLRPSNYRVLVQILSSAEDKGLMTRVFRILSRSGGGIGDYGSITDIPLEVFDDRIGRRVEVSQDDIEMIFIIKQ